MNVYDLGISLGTIILIINHLPQIIRNFQLKRTYSQSIIREVMHECGLVILILCYIGLNLRISASLTVIDFFTEIVLIWQIFTWRENDRHCNIGDTQ